MKFEIIEHGVRMIAENHHDRDVLVRLAGKTLAASHDDAWAVESPVTLRWESHPFDKAGRS